MTDLADLRWITVSEAMRYINLQRKSLYKLIDQGEIPAYKMGRVIRLQAGDLEAFVERARVAPGTLRHLYPEDQREGSSDCAGRGGGTGCSVGCADGGRGLGGG